VAEDEEGVGWTSLATLAAFAAGCFAVAALGGWLTAASVETWYPTLAKPAWTPPSSVFGPVWTALYAMMAVSGWLAWRGSWGRRRRRAMVAFGTQLGLNLAWSGLFFGLQAPGWALVEIVALLAAIGWTIAIFARVDRRAAWLLVPYLLWVAYAATLNAGIWWLN
jgi:tryptophan-rich sensory protein